MKYSTIWHLFSDFCLQQVVTLWLYEHLFPSTVVLSVHLLNLHFVTNKVVLPLNVFTISVERLYVRPTEIEVTVKLFL
jgi:hypothetical protein